THLSRRKSQERPLNVGAISAQQQFRLNLHTHTHTARHQMSHTNPSSVTAMTYLPHVYPTLLSFKVCVCVCFQFSFFFSLQASAVIHVMMNASSVKVFLVWECVRGVCVRGVCVRGCVLGGVC